MVSAGSTGGGFRRRQRYPRRSGEFVHRIQGVLTHAITVTRQPFIGVAVFVLNNNNSRILGPRPRPILAVTHVTGGACAHIHITKLSNNAAICRPVNDIPYSAIIIRSTSAPGISKTTNHQKTTLAAGAFFDRLVNKFLVIAFEMAVGKQERTGCIRAKTDSVTASIVITDVIKINRRSVAVNINIIFGAVGQDAVIQPPPLTGIQSCCSWLRQAASIRIGITVFETNHVGIVIAECQPISAVEHPDITYNGIPDVKVCSPIRAASTVPQDNAMRRIILAAAFDIEEAARVDSEATLVSRSTVVAVTHPTA